MADGLVRATVAALRTQGRTKPVHLRAEHVRRGESIPTRACDPMIPTKSLLTHEPANVTCARCRLTNRFKASVELEAKQ